MIPTTFQTVSVQDIQLELIRRTAFNNFNGTQIVSDLEKHRDLWLSVLIDRPCDIDIKLRDLPENIWNVDTLFILSSGKDDEELELLAESWRPDNINWLKARRIMCIWWD